MQMDVETTYKFDGDAQVSEVSSFLRERYVNRGWGTDHDDGKPRAKPTAIGGYESGGGLRIELTEEHESASNEGDEAE